MSIPLIAQGANNIALQNRALHFNLKILRKKHSIFAHYIPIFDISLFVSSIFTSACEGYGHPVKRLTDISWTQFLIVTRILTTKHACFDIEICILKNNAENIFQSIQFKFVVFTKITQESE